MHISDIHQFSIFIPSWYITIFSVTSSYSQSSHVFNSLICCNNNNINGPLMGWKCIWNYTEYAYHTFISLGMSKGELSYCTCVPDIVSYISSLFQVSSNNSGKPSIFNQSLNISQSRFRKNTHELFFPPKVSR